MGVAFRMVCPFIDHNLKGCGEVLTLDNVQAAMSLCSDNFVVCPLFRAKYAQQNLSITEKLRRQTTRLLFGARD